MHKRVQSLVESYKSTVIYRNINRNAFTLAEVLITLGIIGVVAALTMPSLIGNYKKQQAIQQVKKAYSVLSQAYTRAVADYGDSSEWDELNEDNAVDNYDTYWWPYFQSPVRCYSYKECGYDEHTPFFKANKGKDGYIVEVHGGSRFLFHLNDGTFVMIITGSGYGDDDRRILVDLNGAKLPNRFGNDVFFFLRVNGKGVVPYGYDKSVDEVNSDCSKTGNGYMCAAKLMQAGWQMEKDYPF